MICVARRRLEEAVVDGWCSVEELVRHGFAQAPVVMANEAHNGLTRCVRTREVGIRMIRAAHDAGVRRLAMEALPWPDEDIPGPIRDIPQASSGYLAQPEMRRLIAVALELGWTLWAYEAVVEMTADTDPAEFLTMEFTNWREREQAASLCRLTAAAPAEPLLVWCGNGHASKVEFGDWTPMGWHFRALSGIDPFVIDQTVTVAFNDPPRPWVQALLAELGDTLAAHGGTAGILSAQAPQPLSGRDYVDALVVSTENILT
jgi:hypothetical protein